MVGRSSRLRSPSELRRLAGRCCIPFMLLAVSYASALPSLSAITLHWSAAVLLLPLLLPLHWTRDSIICLEVGNASYSTSCGLIISPYKWVYRQGWWKAVFMGNIPLATNAAQIAWRWYSCSEVFLKRHGGYPLCAAVLVTMEAAGYVFGSSLSDSGLLHGTGRSGPWLVTLKTAVVDCPCVCVCVCVCVPIW